MSRNHVRPNRAAAWVLSSVLVGFTAWSAWAAHASSDRAVAEQILASQAPAASSGSASAMSAPLHQARRALDRADRAREAGDTLHAEQLEGLAREWAEYAKDTATAEAAERRAAAAQSAAANAATRVKRARALLEEEMATRARAQGELKSLQESADAGVGSDAVRVMLTAPRGSSSSAHRPSKPPASSTATPTPAPGEEP